MNKKDSNISIVSINNNGYERSCFNHKNIQLHGSSERFLSDQINAENFRLRTSNNSYSSSWHVAGDPTLLVILSGTLRIELRSGESRNFSAGEMFIANDYLKKNIEFDDSAHGHRAEALGDHVFSALHIKLEKRTS